MRVDWICVLALIWGAWPASARPAIVTAGEHAGFTRVVIEFGGPVDWQLGRGPQGYRLRVKPKAPIYDLKTVFNLIKKNRLTAAQVDPDSGDLKLNFSCRCYAMPYEDRPGVVVVDLRDGVAPTASSFELPLENSAPAEVAAEGAFSKPLYDWATLSLPTPVTSLALPTPSAPPGMPLAPVNQTLEPLRLSLIQDLSRGASQGLVDLIVPEQIAAPSLDPGSLPRQISVHADPNFAIRQGAAPNSPMTAQGATCWSDDQLDITAWAGQQPIAAQMGPQRQGLTAEFDRPDPAAVTRAVRYDLFLGFGAEARSLIRTFYPNAPDAALWQSMAQILDEQADTAHSFDAMQECETAAALWATLAQPNSSPNTPQAKAALLRSFSAWPPHLRRLLGPNLVESVLLAGDITLATALYEAIQRALGDESPAVVRMQAKMDQALGNSDAAISRVNDLAKAPGPGAPEALVDLVELQASLGRPVTFAQVQALEAYLLERRGGPDAPRFQRALVLAKAASGDFDGAFAFQDTSDDVAATLWKLLVQSGQTSTFLTYASLRPSDAVPPVAKGVAVQIAERMLGIGLPNQASLWLAQAPKAPLELLARVKLAQGDAQSALGLLAEDESAAALDLKAKAYQSLDKPKQAADIYSQLGQMENHWKAIRQANDWPALAAQGPAPWKAMASLVTTPAPLPEQAKGALAHDRDLLALSVATRETIGLLLQQTKAPFSISQ